MTIPVPNLVTVVLAVLVLLCGKTDADDRLIHVTTVGMSNK